MCDLPGDLRAWGRAALPTLSARVPYAVRGQLARRPTQLHVLPTHMPSLQSCAHRIALPVVKVGVNFPIRAVVGVGFPARACASVRQVGETTTEETSDDTVERDV